MFSIGQVETTDDEAPRVRDWIMESRIQIQYFIM